VNWRTVEPASRACFGLLKMQTTEFSPRRFFLDIDVASKNVSETLRRFCLCRVIDGDNGNHFVAIN
jgi:hypothetical protein